MTGVVLVVVAVTDRDGQRVGAADRGMTAVLHYDRHQILLLALPVKLLQARHDARAVSVTTATCGGKCGASMVGTYQRIKC